MRKGLVKFLGDFKEYNENKLRFFSFIKLDS